MYIYIVSEMEFIQHLTRSLRSARTVELPSGKPSLKCSFLFCIDIDCISEFHNNILCLCALPKKIACEFFDILP